MRTLMFLATILSAVASGFWAYEENYRTQVAINEVDSLQRQIGAAYEELNILELEWAYLNRPDRLYDLEQMNFDQLGLLPLSPERFVRIDQIPMRQPIPLETNGRNDD